ncbi:hypothetical protein JJQ94_12475 [Pseudoalteromonas sp. GCY]|uniref:hypothetical protein n=1 Tax=Pseudoalteromonas sp. GCY TaxID=2003316 RepID=UPI0015516994|nr:hypothetical protein [Pseudoalteromonas sp. GCY]QQQ68552.1 hypothetical protein JJQ94_12475 [Pseudoalteromonas sp. GCY]
MRWRIKFEYAFTIDSDFIDIEAPSYEAAERYTLDLDVYVVSIKPILRVKLC